MNEDKLWTIDNIGFYVLDNREFLSTTEGIKDFLQVAKQVYDKERFVLINTGDVFFEIDYDGNVLGKIGNNTREISAQGEVYNVDDAIYLHGKIDDVIVTIHAENLAEVSVKDDPVLLHREDYLVGSYLSKHLTSGKVERFNEKERKEYDTIKDGASEYLAYTPEYAQLKNLQSSITEASKSYEDERKRLEDRSRAERWRDLNTWSDEQKNIIVSQIVRAMKSPEYAMFKQATKDNNVVLKNGIGKMIIDSKSNKKYDFGDYVKIKKNKDKTIEIDVFDNMEMKPMAPHIMHRMIIGKEGTTYKCEYFDQKVNPELYEEAVKLHNDVKKITDEMYKKENKKRA